MGTSHLPVMKQACLDMLNIRPDRRYLDATLGLGGHAYAIAARLTSGELIGIDRDKESLEKARETLSALPCRQRLIHGDYRHLLSYGLPPLDGALFDLGVSSPQFDTPERGFSYRHEAPLDMRMNRDDPLTAYTLVNTWPPEEITRILYAYGEERYAPLITRAIVRQRQIAPIVTTTELAGVILSALPAAARRGKGHPAKQSFQALRMAVNDELSGIEQGLTDVVTLLAPGGRLAVLTFHSLEDRLVKHLFVKEARGCTCPPDFPACVCGRKPTLRLITKRPLTPSAEELNNNPRAHSAKLRVAEKIEPV